MTEGKSRKQMSQKRLCSHRSKPASWDLSSSVGLAWGSLDLCQVLATSNLLRVLQVLSTVLGFPFLLGFFPSFIWQRNLPFAISLPKSLQWPGLRQAKPVGGRQPRAPTSVAGTQLPQPHRVCTGRKLPCGAQARNCTLLGNRGVPTYIFSTRPQPCPWVSLSYRETQSLCASAIHTSYASHTYGACWTTAQKENSRAESIQPV